MAIDQKQTIALGTFDNTRSLRRAVEELLRQYTSPKDMVIVCRKGSFEGELRRLKENDKLFIPVALFLVDESEGVRKIVTSGNSIPDPLQITSSDVRDWLSSLFGTLENHFARDCCVILLRVTDVDSVRKVGEVLLRFSADKMLTDEIRMQK